MTINRFAVALALLLHGQADTRASCHGDTAYRDAIGCRGRHRARARRTARPWVEAAKTSLCLENKSPQIIKRFEEHTSTTPKALAPAAPTLPAGTYNRLHAGTPRKHIEYSPVRCAEYAHDRPGLCARAVAGVRETRPSRQPHRHLWVGKSSISAAGIYLRSRHAEGGSESQAETVFFDALGRSKPDPTRIQPPFQMCSAMARPRHPKRRRASRRSQRTCNNLKMESKAVQMQLRVQYNAGCVQRAWTLSGQLSRPQKFDLVFRIVSFERLLPDATIQSGSPIHAEQ